MMGSPSCTNAINDRNTLYFQNSHHNNLRITERNTQHTHNTPKTTTTNTISKTITRNAFVCFVHIWSMVAEINSNEQPHIIEIEMNATI